MNRLLVEGLHFSHSRRPVLRGVDLSCVQGEVLTVLGPSGSGKTTLLWLLAGLLAPDRGRVTFADNEAKRHIGFVFQDAGLWEHLSAQAHLDTVLRGRGLTRVDRAKRVARGLAEAGLSTFARRRPGELSGGQRQRLALARALVIEPRWLFLDEPTSQLDGPAREELVDLLDQRLAAHPAAVVLATHQVDLALRLSDRVAVLLDGRVAQVGPPNEMYDCPASLAVARLLGPAFEMQVGDAPRILRPHHVRFDTDPAGAAVVRACRYAGGRWLLEVQEREAVVPVHADAPLAVGTSGSVVVLRSESLR